MSQSSETKSMSDTLFGKIAAGEIPADIVYQDEDIVAFRDGEKVYSFHSKFVVVVG